METFCWNCDSPIAAPENSDAVENSWDKHYLLGDQKCISTSICERKSIESSTQKSNPTPNSESGSNAESNNRRYRFRKRKPDQLNSEYDQLLNEIRMCISLLQDEIDSLEDSECVCAGILPVDYKAKQLSTVYGPSNIQLKMDVGRFGLQATRRLPGFSLLHFRGTPVISSLSANMISKTIIFGKFNEKLKPSSHLSPHFTFPSPRTHFDDYNLLPLIYALQAHDDIRSGNEAKLYRVRACLANHYCIKCCSAFFECDERGFPVLVVRPEGCEIGDFGVYYGKNNVTYSCAKCGHQCIPRDHLTHHCKECLSVEREWIKLWARQRRFHSHRDVSKK